jgi:5-methylcytosine-specific restriction enzyme subunit McrC
VNQLLDQMKQILLREYESSQPIRLSGDAVLKLRTLVPRLTIEPVIGQRDSYVITPGSYIGVVRIPGVQVDIRPKIPIDRLFFILSYAVDPTNWLSDEIGLAKDDSVLEAVAPIFCRAVANATRRGLLHGYRTQEEALTTVRGQVRFADQLRHHYGMLLPVELRFDEFTEDILENQVLLAAMQCLKQLPIRSAGVQRGLQEIMSAFHSVSECSFSGRLPEFHFDRLNRHYESALRLASLILQSGSLEMGTREIGGHAFLMDMNVIFELFVHRALREVFGLSEMEFPRGDKRLRLDEARSIKLEPDLSLWKNGHCEFVGDVKYKRVTVAGIKHPDIYQLLAYTIAAQLASGLLIYAKGEASDTSHVIRHADKTLHVECLDLGKEPKQILEDIRQIGIKMLAPATSVASM